MTATVQLTALVTPTERELTAQVLQLAHLCGWLTFHVRASRRADGRWDTPIQGDGAGFPDIVAVRADGRLLFIELKAEHGRLAPLQQRWRDALAAVPGAETYVFRPSDWDRVVEVLK